VTEDNRRQAIAQDLRQSELALKAARLLKDAGIYNDALSRLYYAIHHATTALLMTESIEPRRHRAVPSLLSTHFLPSGVLTPEDIATVSRAQSYRDLADESRAWNATAAIADEAFAVVEPLIERIRGVLDRGGWIHPASGERAPLTAASAAPAPPPTPPR
jgi:uncharacterized protein (UPF0332 family)